MTLLCEILWTLFIVMVFCFGVFLEMLSGAFDSAFGYGHKKDLIATTLLIAVWIGGVVFIAWFGGWRISGQF